MGDRLDIHIYKYNHIFLLCMKHIVILESISDAIGHIVGLG